VSEAAAILFGEEEIRRRVRELGEAITRDYADHPPVLITMLKGGVVFLADLIRCIDLPLRVDFMSISSYGRGSEATGGVVRILKDLDHDIGNDHVLIVEDIVDTGLTLSYLMTALQARNPASLHICALLDKSARRITPLHIRYRGFECPDQFVVGYGLDHQERYRNLPFILGVQDPATASAAVDAYLAGMMMQSGTGPST